MTTMGILAYIFSFVSILFSFTPWGQGVVIALPSSGTTYEARNQRAPVTPSITGNQHDATTSSTPTQPIPSPVSDPAQKPARLLNRQSAFANRSEQLRTHSSELRTSQGNIAKARHQFWQVAAEL